MITVAGNPVVSTPDTRPARPRVRVARLHGGGRHLPQRDHPARRRDPAGAAGAHQEPLRPRALLARDPQRRELLAAGRRADAATRSPEWETLLRLAAIARRPGDERRAAAGALDDFALADRGAEGGDPQRDRRSRAATPASSSTSCRPTAGAGPERVLDFMLRTGAVRRPVRCRRPRRWSVARGPRGEPARRRPRPAAAAPARGAARRRSGTIELAPDAIVADVEAAPDPVARPARQRRDGARRPARPALEQLVDAQPRDPGEGQAALHAAGPSGRRRALRRGRRRADPGALACRARSRSRPR